MYFCLVSVKSIAVNNSYQWNSSLMDTYLYFFRVNEVGEAVIDIQGPITLGSLEIEHLNITGTIDDLPWEEMQTDAVLIGETAVITGRKLIDEEVAIPELVVEGNINGKPAEEFIEELVRKEKVRVYDGDLKLNNSVQVQEIFVNGEILPI